MAWQDDAGTQVLTEEQAFAEEELLTEDGAGETAGAVLRWLAQRSAARPASVERIAFDDLEGWAFQEDTGDLRHRSGKFFSVEGLRVTTGAPPFPAWQQPIINQPEVGILGILAKDFGGVRHYLLQAKMEPGNPNLVQLSPTVQATRSNYTGAHGGRAVRYLEHFTQAPERRVLADVLQSEHGSWFFRKSNRNMLVEVDQETELEAHPDFRWVSAGALRELLRLDNVVNMDARTVLSCAPHDSARPAPHGPGTGLLSWFTGERSRHQVDARTVPLVSVEGWARTKERIYHRRERYFDIVAVGVRAEAREVAGWTQPLLRPCGRGIAAFLFRRVEGEPQLLVHARVEGGFLDTVELGPTVQCTPENHGHLPAEHRPPFLDMVLDAPADRIRYEAVHSEEGGRFLAAESRYAVVEADEDRLPRSLPPGFRWVTPAQLNSLLQHGHYVNVQARTLMACINTGAVQL